MKGAAATDSAPTDALPALGRAAPGCPVSRLAALRIARGILERAEGERQALALWEAMQGGQAAE